MAMTPEERYKAVSNVIARKGMDGINLHAELAKLESYVNGLDQQAMMQPPTPPIQGDTAPIMGQESLSTTEEEIVPETL